MSVSVGETSTFELPFHAQHRNDISADCWISELLSQLINANLVMDKDVLVDSEKEPGKFVVILVEDKQKCYLQCGVY